MVITKYMFFSWYITLQLALSLEIEIPPPCEYARVDACVYVLAGIANSNLFLPADSQKLINSEVNLEKKNTFSAIIRKWNLRSDEANLGSSHTGTRVCDLQSLLAWSEMGEVWYSGRGSQGSAWAGGLGGLGAEGRIPWQVFINQNGGHPKCTR